MSACMGLDHNGRACFCCRLTWGWIAGKADVSIDAEHYILDWKFRNRVVNILSELLRELLNERVPILLRLTKLGVVY